MFTWLKKPKGFWRQVFKEFIGCAWSTLLLLGIILWQIAQSDSTDKGKIIFGVVFLGLLSLIWTIGALAIEQKYLWIKKHLPKEEYDKVQTQWESFSKKEEGILPNKKTN